ncbi:MAG: Rib/alpha-like domain-containing protein, partial [Planctomycetota bacterium]|nr:Rib/alpha-like domain-containing protein [Planctomycetota bacterium]
LTAMRVYQTWITDLAFLSKLETINVTPGRKIQKRGVYSAVQVTLKAEATFENVVRFLYHFNRTNLKQRIVELALESETNEGDPVLGVTIVAEGLALEDAELRDTIFPLAKLTKAVDDSETALTIVDAKGFPKSGEFNVRIGNEFLKVVSQNEDGTWEVARGVQETESLGHNADSEIELHPVREDWAARTLAEFRTSIVDRHPFVLPAPPREYEPRLRSISTREVRRGETAKFTALSSGFDPALGKEQFRLGADAVEGMKIDPKTGEFEWAIADDAEPRDVKVTVEAMQPDREKQVVSTMATIRISQPNSPPILKLYDTYSIYFGESVTFDTEADDPDGDSRLKFELGENPPTGATIDPATGRFEWTPPDDAEPGEFEVEIKVTDSGQPALSDSRKVRIEVKEDIARFTFLVLCFREGDRRMAWLLNQFDNQRMEIYEGVTFTIADMKPTVLSIGGKFVMLQVGDETWELELGKNMRQMHKLEFPKAEPAETDKKPVATTPAVPESKTPAESEIRNETPDAKPIPAKPSPADAAADKVESGKD